jgi:hypothetical protein
MGQHSVSRPLFLAVITKHGFTFEAMEDGRMRFLLEGFPPEVHLIEDQVARKVVMRFAHKYKIPRAEFWPASLRAVAHSQ